ncbi:hypothetical protein Pmani_039837 [Petrolisthes manimaculis]|uniref:G-protein coupled receptors family 1 profile domain-containing protein n=1 Tax=Petrolisthes manimaculis TaxID=1843537 RepID=A0AAE1NBY4_9EUCA|nr:hypothetical protein Pmani_039837 [Petrolisthes manimaculis]
MKWLVLEVTRFIHDNQVLEVHNRQSPLTERYTTDSHHSQRGTQQTLTTHRDVHNRTDSHYSQRGTQQTLTTHREVHNRHSLLTEKYTTDTHYSQRGIVLSFVIFLSIFGNVLVCLAVYTDRNLRKIGNLFVVSLAIADLFVACVVMTFALVNDLLGHWPFGPEYCDIWIAFDVMCSTASIVNLCAISLDRYIHIKTLTWFGYTNSSFNPIIYSIFNQEFREAFKRILTSRCRLCPTCCCCRNPCYGDSPYGDPCCDSCCGDSCCAESCSFTSCCRFEKRRPREGSTVIGVRGGSSRCPREGPRTHQNGSSSTALTEYTVLDTTATPKFPHDRSRASSGERCLILEQISAI